jgi:hypothetical protein
MVCTAVVLCFSLLSSSSYVAENVPDSRDKQILASVSVVYEGDKWAPPALRAEPSMGCLYVLSIKDGSPLVIVVSVTKRKRRDSG